MLLGEVFLKVRTKSGASTECYFELTDRYCQRIRRSVINQLTPRAYREIPANIQVRITKEEEGKTLLCASCGIQRGDQVSTPRLGRMSARCFFHPLPSTNKAKSKFLEGSLGNPRWAVHPFIPQSNPQPQLKINIVVVQYCSLKAKR